MHPVEIVILIIILIIKAVISYYVIREFLRSFGPLWTGKVSIEVIMTLIAILTALWARELMDLLLWLTRMEM